MWLVQPTFLPGVSGIYNQVRSVSTIFWHLKIVENKRLIRWPINTLLMKYRRGAGTLWIFYTCTYNTAQLLLVNIKNKIKTTVANHTSRILETRWHFGFQSSEIFLVRWHRYFHQSIFSYLGFHFSALETTKLAAC